MSARIQVLPDDLADQIAAGEVVERPASIVKELLENAIDAGAMRVQVEIEGGGIERVRVVDDGSGMSPADATLAVRRHATSKLRTRDDLMAIATLGFRGEALPSIASVARFSLETREPDAVEGTRVEIEGGAAPRVAPVGAPKGTAVEVRDLFFNVPARLKFLKSRATESGHVGSVVMRAALAYPGLALSLVSDRRRVREYLPARSFGERATQVLAGEALTTFEVEADGVHLEAALGAPERARAGASGLHVFVNGRPVRDASLARAIAFAYGSVLPPGRYPSGAVHVRVDPSTVDVNVHPQKLEVRFANARPTFDVITKLVAKQLGTSAWRGPARRPESYWDQRLGLSAGFGVAEATGAPRAPLASSVNDAEANDAWGLATSTSAESAVLSAALPPPVEAHAQPQMSSLLGATGFFGSMRVLGQVRRMLIVCEGASALYFLDQHAADERIRYDRLRRSYAARDVQTQRLLFPERVECTEAEAALVEERQDVLTALGMECSLLGPRTVAVHTVPMVVQRATPERLLRDLLDELERRGERAFSDAVDMALATMACHAAIRAGDPLSNEQAQRLLQNLDEVGDFAGHCPHGRPVVQSLPFAELERKLGR